MQITTLNNEKEFLLAKKTFHSLPEDNAHRGNILTLLTTYRRPGKGTLSRELFEMDELNFVWNEDSGAGVLMGHDCHNTTTCKYCKNK